MSVWYNCTVWGLNKLRGKAEEFMKVHLAILQPIYHAHSTFSYWHASFLVTMVIYSNIQSITSLTFLCRGSWFAVQCAMC